MDDHIGEAVAIDVLKTQRDGDQVGIRSIELRSEIDACMGRISAREFDDFDTAMKVKGDK